MTILISLFNHKGGVSKTTTTFNLGWALADLGKKVLIVDGDPQCNLTGTVLGFNGDSDFEYFYSNHPYSNLNICLEPSFKGLQKPLQAAKIISTENNNLFLLAGHIDLAENESQLAVALTTGSAIPALQNLPGSVTHLIRLTAEQNEIDIVLLDMSPSVGALNQCFLMGSDYFMVPTSPDYYCDQAIRSLARVIPKWNTSTAPFRNSILTYPFQNPPQFLGTISQRYRPHSGKPAVSFQRWIDKIKNTSKTQLVPALTPINMAIPLTKFQSVNMNDTPYNFVTLH